MKFIQVLIIPLLLTSCLFKGPYNNTDYYYWKLKDRSKVKTAPGEDYYLAYFKFRAKEMEACGMDTVRRSSLYPKVNLCMEKKGWYLEGGPVCENELQWMEPLCIEWRKKYSAPDVKPWSYDKNSEYITKLLKLEQAPMKMEPRKRNTFFSWLFSK